MQSKELHNSLCKTPEDAEEHPDSDVKDPCPSNGEVETDPHLSEDTATAKANTDGSRSAAAVEFETTATLPRRVSCLGNSSRFASRSLRDSSVLRNLPTDILLKPDFGRYSSCALTLPPSMREIEEEEAEQKDDCVHRTFLRSDYTLRKQMILSFFTINAITVTFVVIVSILVAVLASERIKANNQDAFEHLEREMQRGTARYLAQTLEQKYLLFDAVSIIKEATQDRFEGYPKASDDDVPFTDIYSGSRKYPLSSEELLEIEWNFEETVNEENYEEHLQSRWDFYGSAATTAKAAFLMQGICDPAAEWDTDTYWPNCTNANNDILTGGIVAPSETTEIIYRKGSDIVPLLKGLFEAREEIRDLGLYFINNGAGASISYPQYTLSTNNTYTSVGCEWMKEPNPYNKSKPIGTQAMIDLCHEKDKNVSNRVYNPMERQWCIEQAKNPDKNHVFVYEDGWKAGTWLVSLGNGIYDRTTNEFIACSYIGILLSTINDELKKFQITYKSEVSLLIWNDNGDIIASTNEQFSEAAAAANSITDAGFGLTNDSYSELYNLIDYDSEWDPSDVQEKYEEFTARADGYFVTCSPVPSVPEEYDPSYRPVFIILMSTAEDDFFTFSNYLNDDITNLVYVAISVGFGGLVLVTLVIFLMANVLTFPLRAMNKAASEIINKTADATEDVKPIDVEEALSEKPACTPTTELTELAAEFNKMALTFSGKMMAKSDKGKHGEVENLFRIREQFHELYASRSKSDFVYTIESKEVDFLSKNEEMTQYSVNFLHVGSNILVSDKTLPKSIQDPGKFTKSTKWSPIFLWTVALIVLPLLIINAVIITYILYEMSNGTFNESIEKAQASFLELRKTGLMHHSALRAKYIAGLTTKSIDGLHLLTRYSSWLLFGGLKRSGSFTELTTGAEQCKNHATNWSSCDYIQKNEICDCSWNDALSQVCQNYTKPSRDKQRSHFVVQSTDTQFDGTRNSTSYPDTSSSPETTAWRVNQTMLPGSNSLHNASGYETTYDRLRAISAVPIMEVLYNYDTEKRAILQSFVAFEADGLLFGYSGCRNADNAKRSAWVSTEANGAAKLRPELCPPGKYGYEPRCQEWYDTGRKLHTKKNSSLYITPIFDFESSGLLAQSATTPLADPQTRKHVGQVVVDLDRSSLYDALNDNTSLSEGGFPLMLTLKDGSGDGAIAPDAWSSEVFPHISKLVLPEDTTCNEVECRERVKQFEENIYEDMKNGNENLTEIARITPHGDVETIYLAYGPVAVKSFLPLDSSDFSRGIAVSEYPFFSLGLAETKQSILKPFEKIEASAQEQANIAIGILSVVMAAVVFVLVFTYHRLAKSFAEPILCLLEKIRFINRNGVEKEPTSEKNIRGPYEVLALSETVQILFKLIGASNDAYHAGAIDYAYSVLDEILKLFKRMDNKKAIGVASNNLGNTVLAMYLQSKAQDSDFVSNITEKEMVILGISYFHTAIQVGEELYDEFKEQQSWTPICLDFMQHLSNRYFNRGIFLLLVKDDHDEPEKLEELGRRDLQISQDMDDEVVAYGEDIGWGSQERDEKTFNVKLARLRGYNILIRMGYSDDWEIEEMLDEVFDFIRKESKRDASWLFEKISVAGRLQEIETELLKYKVHVGDMETAAKIAIRMLVEDESVFADAFSQAVEILLRFVTEGSQFDQSSRSKIKSSLEDYIEILEDISESQQKSSLRSLEFSTDSKRFGDLSTKGLRKCALSNWSLRNGSGRYVTMEDF